MRFLFIAPRFHTNLYYRVKALQDAGHKTRVLVLYRGISEFYKDIDLKVIGYSKLFLFINSFFEKRKNNYLKSSFELKFGFPSTEHLKSEIDDFDPDLIVLKAFQDALSFFVLRLAKKKKIKVIILTQTKKNHIWGSIFLFKLYLWLLKKLNVICYTSPVRKTKEVFNRIDVTNVFYIPFVFPSIDFKKKYFQREKINIMVVGKFVERKKILFLLKVIYDLLKERQDIALNIFGERADLQYFRKVKNFIKDNKMERCVTMRCGVRYSNILKEYRKNDLFILPSSAEPAAYSIVEAMANKLPVICSDECGTKCYIENGKNGYIFMANNKEDLKNKILLIIEQKESVIIFGKKGFEIAQKKHCLKKFVVSFLGALKSKTLIK